MKKIFLMTLPFFFAAAFISCQQSGQVAEKTAQTSSESSDQGYLKAQVQKLLNQYFVLKDALVATQAEESATAAASLLQILKEADASQMDAADAAVYLTHSEQMQTAVAQIATEIDVEAQRVTFEQLTAEMLALVKAFKPSDETIYYQYCPMAFDFKGAYWLSNEKKVMNPYFGDKMLHCGKVAEEI